MVYNMKSTEVLNPRRHYDGTGEAPLAARVEPRCGAASLQNLCSKGELEKKNDDFS